MKVILCGYYGLGNGGDEALLASLLQMLPPAVIPVILSGNKLHTSELASNALGQGRMFQVIDRMGLVSVIRAIRDADAFIWGGGSLIQDATSGLSPLYYGGLMALAQIMGLKTIAWAQGVGPLQYPFTRWLARQTFRHCQAVSVRNSESATLMARWHIPTVLAPDPVWTLKGVNVPEIETLPTPRIAVNLRPHPQLTPERLHLFIQSLVQFQRATHGSIVLVPFQSSQDMTITKMIQPHLTGAHTVVNLTNPQQLKGLFRGVEMAISMRYHGLIMAAAEGCRCFAISYDPKVSSLMVELSIPGWSLTGGDHHPAFPTSADTMYHQWLTHYNAPNQLTQDHTQIYGNRALLHRDVLTQVLEKGR
ncbi:MAG: polysaccharide pyruvyl transferase CsaB [Synechococcales cyanobacterium]